MKWLLVAFALAVLSGCAAEMARVSAGHIGCHPDDITIEDVRPGIHTASWIAKCKGKAYICSGSNERNSCKPMEQ